MNEIELEAKHVQRRRTRERILAAAREIVLQHGYANLSMRRLAAAVGYSPAALYMHFASRDEIAHILRREALAGLAEALDAQAHDSADIHPVQAVGRAWLNFARAQPQLYTLGFIDRLQPELLGPADAPLGDPAAPVLQSVLRALRSEIEPSVQAGSTVPVYGLDARAETVIAVLHGLATLQLLQPAILSVSTEALLQLALRSLLRGWPGVHETRA